MEALLLILVLVLFISLLGSGSQKRQLQALEAENLLYKELVTNISRQNGQTASEGCMIPFVSVIVIVAIALILLAA